MANSLRSNVDGTMSILNGSGTEVANFPLTAPQQVNIGAKGITLGTAVTASGTSIDFTGIPSWAKRITIPFDSISTSGSSNILVQIGNGTIQNTGYSSQATGSAGVTSTAGFIVTHSTGSSTKSTGAIVINLIGTNTYVSSGILADTSGGVGGNHSGGSVALSGTLDLIRITTVNGTDTFDAGTINIMWEG